MLANEATYEEGWLAKNPRFRYEEEMLSCYTNVIFRKNASSSRLMRTVVMDPEAVACTFDFSDKLIIASTTGSTRLGKLETKGYMPIRSITKIKEFSYPGDFLFWLVYWHDEKGGQLTKDIKIIDAQAISSKHEVMSRRESISAATQVTKQLGTKVILAENEFVSTIKITVHYKDVPYVFSLSQSGGISTSYPYTNEEESDEEIKINLKEDLKNKALYAKQIHEIVQLCEREYEKYRLVNDWDNIKKDYQKKKAKESTEELNKMHGLN